MLIQLADEFTPALQAAQVEIQINMPKDIYIYGDANYLARAFQNILKNAVAYSCLLYTSGPVHMGMLRPAVCVQLYLRLGLHGGGAAGGRGAGDLLAAKRRDPVGDRFPGQPGGPSDGCRLAGEQGAGPCLLYTSRCV